MARTLTTDLVTEKNKLHQTSPWIWLLEVAISDSSSIRIASYQQNVAFNGDTYYAFPFTVGAFRQSGEGQTPTLSLTVPNVTREIQVLLDANDGLSRRKVWVRLVHADYLADGDAKIEDRFTVQQAVATAEAVSFTLGRTDLTTAQVPKRRYVRSYCTLVYEGEACGYSTGLLSSCDHTLNGKRGCIVHGDTDVAAGYTRKHPRRFGGCPNIAKQRN